MSRLSERDAALAAEVRRPSPWIFQRECDQRRNLHRWLGVSINHLWPKEQAHFDWCYARDRERQIKNPRPKPEELQ